MQKHYNYLNIDLDKKIHTKLKAKQGDTKSRYILVNLISNSTYYDLSDCAVDIYGIKKDKTIFFNHATVTNAKQGQFEIELTTQALAVPGEIEIQILILGTTQERLTTFSFFIDVGKTIVDDAAIESTNEFTALTEALSSVQNIDNRFREVDEQFNTIKKQNTKINCIAYGALSNDSEPTNTTNAIKQAISNNPNGGVLYLPYGTYAINDTIVIPSNFSFICEGTLKYYGERDRAILHFNRQVSSDIYIHNVIDQVSTFHGWGSEQYIGIIFENMFKCRVKIDKIQNTTTGICIKATGGSNYGHFFNEYDVMNMIDCKVFYNFNQDGANSWINSNKIKNTSFSLTQVSDSSNPYYGFANSEVNRYGIIQTFTNSNAYTSDSNIFENIKFDIGSSIKGTFTGIYLSNAWGWLFDKYRVEFVNNSAKFAILDLTLNKVYGIKFNPLFETYSTSDNVKIHWINDTGARSINDVFIKTGANSNNELYKVFETDRFNERYSQDSANNKVDNMYWFRINATTLDKSSETSYEWNESPKNILTDNGINISTYYLGVYYIKNISKGDIFQVKLKSSVGGANHQICLKCFDGTNTIMSKLSTTNIQNISSNNIYYDSTNKVFRQNVNGSMLSFSVNNDEVKTIAVMFCGGVNGLEIYSSNPKISILKSCDNERNNSKTLI